jgi:hypothetical protein
MRGNVNRKPPPRDTGAPHREIKAPISNSEYLMLCSPEDLDMNVWIVRAAVSRDGFKWNVLNNGKGGSGGGGQLLTFDIWHIGT